MTEQTPQPRRRMSFARVLGDFVVDAAGIGGAILITYGVGLTYRPMGFVVGGAFLILGSWILASKGRA